jgi:hypothetical protein
MYYLLKILWKDFRQTKPSKCFQHFVVILPTQNSDQMISHFRLLHTPYSPPPNKLSPSFLDALPCLKPIYP